MFEVIQEIASGLGWLMLKIFLIVIPILMLLEWMQGQRWFERVIKSAQSAFRPVGFRPQSLFPLLTGLLFGISYGAGVLIPQARSGELDRRQVFLITAFLGVCHAVIEDTLLFVAVGANGFVLVGARFLAAVLIVSFLSRLSWPPAGFPTKEGV